MAFERLPIRCPVKVAAPVIAACVVVAAAGSVKSSEAASTTQTFVATADAYVSSKDSTANFGSADQLVVDAPPNPNSNARTVRSFVRFDVSGLTQPVEKATLLLSAVDGGSDVSVHGVGDNSWQEGAITWDNAPDFGSATSSSGSFGAGT